MPNIGAIPGTTLPAGGAAGATLAKLSAANYDVAWSGGAVGGGGLGPLLASGLWVSNLFGAAVAAVSTAISANTCLYLPVYLPASVTVTALGVRVAGTTSTSYLGISSAAADMRPGTLLATAATGPGTAGTSLTTALATATSVPAGWNWVSIGAGSAAFSVYGAASANMRTPMGMPATGPGAGSLVDCYQDTGSSGVPRSAPAMTALTSATLPVVWFKLA